MEHLKFLQENQGAAVIIVLALNVLAKVGKFLWDMNRKEMSSQRKAMEKLTAEMVLLGHQLEKLGLDLNRAFTAIKMISGPEKWEDVRKVITDERSA